MRWSAIPALVPETPLSAFDVTTTYKQQRTPQKAKVGSQMQKQYYNHFANQAFTNSRVHACNKSDTKCKMQKYRIPFKITEAHYYQKSPTHVQITRNPNIRKPKTPKSKMTKTDTHT